jgi:menaquinone-dependent protoporphyrinogen oxidase
MATRSATAMNVLIAVASRHGSTAEIAEVIGADLRQSGLEVDVLDAGHLKSIEPYDAAIVGSAVYMGNWLAEARSFVARHQPRLATIPVWLFSSGPIGADQPQPASPPAHLEELIHATNARGHRTFVGMLDKDKLSLGERLIATVVRAPAGDYRDWDEIDAWARDIAAELRAAQPTKVEQ